MLTKEASQQGAGPAVPHLHVDRDTLSLDLTSGVSLDLHTLTGGLGAST